ncbi:MAG: hypothetical protein IPP33_12865 [Flavobacteriales bacterium]|nr:hypothetical protein [Flavobacteriales bacterium]
MDELPLGALLLRIGGDSGLLKEALASIINLIKHSHEKLENWNAVGAMLWPRGQKFAHNGLAMALLDSIYLPLPWVLQLVLR